MVGSANMKAVWHAFGIGPHPVPPRPVLVGALKYKREEIERIAARVMRATFLGDALSREELRELYAKHIYHETKKFGEEMMENPDEHKRREWACVRMSAGYFCRPSSAHRRGFMPITHRLFAVAFY